MRKRRIIEMAARHFAEADLAMRKGVLCSLEFAESFALKRAGGDTHDPTYQRVKALVDRLVPTVADIEPETLEAFAGATGGSVSVLMETITPALEKLGVTYAPATAQELVEFLMQDLRRPS